jgi:hypothetical protein
MNGNELNRRNKMKEIICKNKNIKEEITVLAITGEKTFLKFKKYSKENTYEFLENKYYGEDILVFNPCYDLMPRVSVLSIEKTNDLIYIIDEFTVEKLFERFPELKEYGSLSLNFILNVSFLELSKNINIKKSNTYKIREKYLELLENNIKNTLNK